MNITYTAKAKEGGEFSQLQRASAYLEELAGPSGVEVTATWDRTDQGSYYLLRLSDGCGEVSEQFSASELRSARRWHWPVLRLWGDLLENRSHKLFDKLVGAGELAEK